MNATRTTQLSTKRPASNDTYAGPGPDEPGSETLPLVLVTVGNGMGEFEALYDHLESIMREPEPTCQSLIVARPEVPDVLYHVLRSRVRQIPNVHLRRLGERVENCEERLHESGTFLVTRKRSQRSG